MILFPLFLSYNKTVSFTYRGFYESTAMPRSVKIVRALGCQFAVIVQRERGREFDVF